MPKIIILHGVKKVYSKYRGWGKNNQLLWLACWPIEQMITYP